MDEIFPETILEKYRDNLFIDLKNALDKHNNDLMKISKGMFKKANSGKSTTNTNAKKKQETNSMDKENINNISITDHLMKNEKNSSITSIFRNIWTYITLGTIAGMFFLLKKKKLNIIN
jgi:hypothetical protein